MGVVAVVGGQGTEGAPREPPGAAGTPPLLRPHRAPGLRGCSAPTIRLWAPGSLARCPAAATGEEGFPARHLGAGLFGGRGSGEVGAQHRGAGRRLQGGVQRLTRLPRGMSGVSHPLAAPRMLVGVSVLPATGSPQRRGANSPRPVCGTTRAPVLCAGATAGRARPLPSPRLRLRGGTGGLVPTSPGVPVPPWVWAAGSCLLAVRPAAVGSVGALQGRVHLVDVGNVPDVRLLDLLGVDALPGGEDPQRGPPGAQSPSFGLWPGGA